MPEAKGSQARDEKGRGAWTDDVQRYRLTDERLRNTHDDISPRSKLGDHAGQTAADLVDGFLRGELRPESLTPLVAVKWKTQVYAAFSNRRLHAVKTWKRPLVIHSLAHSSRMQTQPSQLMRHTAWETRPSGRRPRRKAHGASGRQESFDTGEGTQGGPVLRR